MSPFVFSAQDVTRTRLCIGANCPDEATHGWPLCERCSRQHRRGQPVPLHVTPEPLPPSLQCSACRRELPDDHFNLRQARDSGYTTQRRGRRGMCKDCDSASKREWNTANAEKTAARNRAWRVANRERYNAARRARRASLKDAQANAEGEV